MKPSLRGLLKNGLVFMGGVASLVLAYHPGTSGFLEMTVFVLGGTCVTTGFLWFCWHLGYLLMPVDGHG